MTPAFGLDLAGYSLGRSGFARADAIGNVVDITVYRGHVFGVRLDSSALLAPHIAIERQLLAACLQHGSLLVDIPIDLQGLPYHPEAAHVWELVKRPVDYAFNALPALADRIGAPVARFLHLVAPLLESAPDVLGQRLFETYPAASLSLLGRPSKGYKNQRVERVGGAWEAGDQSKPLLLIVQSLGIHAADGASLTDDEFDGALCALTGVLPPPMRLEGDELGAAVVERVASKSALPAHGLVPRGYVLMRSLPPDLELRLAIRAVSSHTEMLAEVGR